jgi:ABC-type transport system substrate-binding protein
MLVQEGGIALDPQHADAPTPSFRHRDALIAPLSRRAFLRALGTLGGASLLAACGGAAPNQTAAPTAAPAEAPTAAPAAPAATAAPADASTAAPAPTTAPAAPAAPSGEQPRVGGTYRIASGGDFRSLDPPAAEGFDDWWSAGMLLFNQLYFYDKDGQFYADLADEAPAISDDGLVYTIPIRSGVKFHNGRELTADDVKFSLERQLWPDVYSWGKSYMDNVVGYQEVIDGATQDLAGIVVTDPLTIQVTLTKPQAVFPALLSMSMNGIIPRQETLDAGEDWGISKLIGTGPFRFVEWVPEQRAVYERNPEYFKEGLPYLERIEYDLNVEDATTLLRWESGEAEFVPTVPAAEAPRLLSDPAYAKRIRTVEGMIVHRLNMHMQAAPTDNLQVRQAIAHAINREAIVQSVGGLGTPTEHTYALKMLQYDPAFTSSYPYDPAAAQALLAEGGFVDGVDVKLWMGNTPAAIATAEVIQADLLEANIRVEIVTGEAADVEDRLKSGEIQLYQRSWGASFPDAYDYVAPLFTVKAIETGFNFSKYENPRIDELLEQAEALPLSDPQRIAAYHEINDMLVNRDAAVVNMYNRVSVALGSENIRDEALHPVFTLPVLELAWMAEG